MPEPSISIVYGGSNFNVITDTIGQNTICPLININVSCDKDKNGNILSFTNAITLNGTVLGTGISDIAPALSGIKDFFSDPNKQTTPFEIHCGNGSSPIIQYSGTIFESLAADKSDNNWVITIPYTVTLNSYFAPSGQPLIESYTDSWTIEPIQEVSYFNIETPNTYYETRLPGMDTSKPLSITDLNIKGDTFKLSNFIQYRITHRLGAVGKSAISGINGDHKKYAYEQAASWVLDKAKNISKVQTDHPEYSGLVIYDSGKGLGSSGLSLYNHIRTVESSINDGSYSLTDTWIALGTGTQYTEEFTWDISVDEKNLKTVTLNGTIKGLETVGSSGYTILPSTSLSGDITSLEWTKGSNQTKDNNKFANAMLVFNSAIKPQLYQRACAAASYSSGTYIGRPKGGLLNITPISYTEALNPVAGTVGYSAVFNNQPKWLSGVLTSTISIQDTTGSDQVAESFVLGRPLGPILQKVGTTKSERKITIDVTYPMPTGYKESHPQSNDCVINKDRPEYLQLKSLVDSFKPINTTAFATLTPTSPYPIADQGVVFKTSDDKTWNPFEGRFTWNITWVYTTGNCSNF